MYNLTENYEAKIRDYLEKNALVTKYEITRLTPPADKYGITENAIAVYAELSAEDGRTLLDLAVSMAHGEALPDTLITEAKGDGDDDLIARRISPLPLDNEDIFAITSDASLR